MEQRISFITIGVMDLEKMKAFYIKKFGWTTLKDDSGIVFFKLNGFILGLYSAIDLAKDANVSSSGDGFKRFSLSINFRSEREVDEAFEDLGQKQVHIVKPPEKAFWGGYSGYLSDPEDNLWEFAYNPFLSLDQEGNVKMHR
jgi:uncharacterized protein